MGLQRELKDDNCNHGIGCYDKCFNKRSLQRKSWPLTMPTACGGWILKPHLKVQAKQNTIQKADVC